MTEAERGDDATLFPRTVGERLRTKREALGLSLAEVAARTRVPLRHLEAIEAADYAGLPSATYAVGFVRAYARAVDEDEVVLARDVRAEVALVQRPTARYEPYEIADPSRVPSRGLMIVAAGIAIAVLVLAILWFATGFGKNSEEAATPAVAVAVPAPVPSARPVPTGGGQVTLTATDELWMEIYDSDGKRLFTGTMQAGQTFDVPPAAKDPMINIGRPDKLSVTLNGSKVAPLGTGERAIKDVRIGAAALTARAAEASAPVAEPSPAATNGATRSRDVPTAFAPRTPDTQRRATPSRATNRAPAARPTARPRPRASPSREGPENLLPSGFATDRN